MSGAPTKEEAPGSAAAPSIATASSHDDNSSRAGAAQAKRGNSPQLMGPLLRRKKVVSMPVGAGGDFWATTTTGNQLFTLEEGMVASSAAAAPRTKQNSLGHDELPTSVAPRTQRQRQASSGAAGNLLAGVVRRKQVSLDLLGPNDFFVTPAAAASMDPKLPATQEENDAEDVPEELTEEEKAKKELAELEAKLYRPLRFSPPLAKQGAGSNHHGSQHGHGHGHGSKPEPINQEAKAAFLRYARNVQEVNRQILVIQNKHQQEEDDDFKRDELARETAQLLRNQKEIEADEAILKNALSPFHGISEETDGSIEDKSSQEESFTDADDGITRATRSDKIKTGICAIIMLALTVVVAAWGTHVDEHSHIFAPVGLACVTPCAGTLETRDFFDGHNHFEKNEVIDLIMHLDENAQAETDSIVTVDIVGVESGITKKTVEFSQVDHHYRLTHEVLVKVDFENPEEHHIINVNTDSNENLSFTLHAAIRHPLQDSAVIIAACIMVVVYFFILIEVIHRTLVAIFGSMVALMFLFIMHKGETESIAQIMLHMEWSTLGLLFGMMIIVGELSHTGVFEWFSVRLLLASKGSYNRLLVLLCVLTAVASAFLDNVTTMLLVAPVTIDMCSILGVDPRPYLISEVLLSNIGGTATLIGDPPNIIIGSSFDEIGFVDFIINIAPCIFLFCIPVSLGLVLFTYRFYMTSTKMRELDSKELKRTYPIYDEPRLMIAGTVTFFVILMFFLHPVHHKDTAWVALLGAFVTITFTNPHDVQDALRNHVEWDTLLFFAGLFVLVEVCAELGLLAKVGELLADYIESQDEESQLTVAITLLLWVSAITSAFLDNIPYTATMIPVIQILSDELPDTLPLKTLAWALSFGACLGGNGTLLGASANIVTAGISTNKGFEVSFLNFLYPGMMSMVVTVALANIYMLVVFVWA